MDLRANFLMDCLFKMLCINNGSNLSCTVCCPVWRYYLNFGLTSIHSVNHEQSIIVDEEYKHFFELNLATLFVGFYIYYLSNYYHTKHVISLVFFLCNIILEVGLLLIKSYKDIICFVNQHH